MLLPYNRLLLTMLSGGGGDSTVNRDQGRGWVGVESGLSRGGPRNAILAWRVPIDAEPQRLNRVLSGWRLRISTEGPRECRE